MLILSHFMVIYITTSMIVRSLLRLTHKGISFLSWYVVPVGTYYLYILLPNYPINIGNRILFDNDKEGMTFLTTFLLIILYFFKLLYH